MSAPVLLPSPSDLGFLEPTDATIALAIAQIVHNTYDGQRVVLERRVNGNVGATLRDLCSHKFVIIPGPMRFAEVLHKLIARSRSPGFEWTVFIKDAFTTELYASDTTRLPSQVLVQGHQI